MEITKPEILVIGIACRTSNDPGVAMHDIPKLWGLFFAENIMSKIPNKASEDIIALYCDYETDHTRPYTTVIGAPVTSIDLIPEGMVAKIIPASKYALYTVIKEKPTSVYEVWLDVWKANYKRTYTGDFEYYKKSSNEVDVYVAIP